MFSSLRCLDFAGGMAVVPRWRGSQRGDDGLRGYESEPTFTLLAAVVGPPVSVGDLLRQNLPRQVNLVDFSFVDADTSTTHTIN